MIINKKLLAGLASLALGAAPMVGVVHAQEAAPAPQVETPAAQAPALDDAKLQSFAVAFLEVAKVSQTYQPQIEAAGSTEDQQRLQQEATEKMVEAVNASEGITVEEYNTIIQAAQTDPELAQRINTHITQAAGAQQPAPSEQPQQSAPQQ